MSTSNEDIQTKVEKNMKLFSRLMEVFDKMGLPRVTDPSFSVNNCTFSICGARDSLIIYRLWGNNIVDIWFGKSNSDSGGMGKQAFLDDKNHYPSLQCLLKLHKRFIISGRLKILRRFEEREK